MREQVQKTENTSRTIPSNSRASKQAPISEILQAHKDRIDGKPIQRQSVDEEEFLQAQAAQQDHIRAVLQRYKERNIQRYAPEEDEKLIQGKFDTVQREELGEDELLQGKFESTSTTEQESVQREKKPNNTGLPDNLKTGIENLSGYSMDDVKVHYNSDKPAQLHALAYAQGADIHVAPGQEKHLPHEAWHVVQQKQGRVQPTMQLQGVNVNNNEGLEREADVMGNKIYRPISRLIPNINIGYKSVSLLQDSKIIQRQWEFSEDNYIYNDKINNVIWHLTDENKLWYEDTTSKFSKYAGIKYKGSYALWITRGAPLDLLQNEANKCIEITDDLRDDLHEKYKLFVYIITISNLKWDDLKKREPFMKMNWRDQKAIYDSYKKVNPYIEKEDGGIDNYFGPFYKIINPFLREIYANFNDKGYNEILNGKIDNYKTSLIKILKEVREKGGFPGDVDEKMLLETLAGIKGASKEIIKASELEPIKIKEVYRGDSESTIDRLCKALGLNSTEVKNAKEETLVGKSYTQYQFTSTTKNKDIGSPAQTGTIWNIKLGPNCTAKEGGQYLSEKEILFVNKTTFLIKKIVPINKYSKDGANATEHTKFIVYAEQGFY